MAGSVAGLGLGSESSRATVGWPDILRAGGETGAKPGLSPEQVEFDLGYGLVTHEGAGLLTTYGGVSLARLASRNVRLGGRIEVGEWIDLSVEGERTTQGRGAEHQVALYGHLGGVIPSLESDFPIKGDRPVAPMEILMPSEDPLPQGRRG